MLTDHQIASTRTVQARTGFSSWNNHMTCVQISASVADVAGAIERLAGPPPIAPRAYEAALEVTWGAGGLVAVRCEIPHPTGPITISYPLPGSSPDSSLVWLEAAPLVCSREALYDLGVELVSALGYSTR